MTVAAGSAPLITIHVVAVSIWVGGLVTIFVVARAAGATLEPAQRVAFFRSFGRRWGVVGSTALLIALGSGAILLRNHPRNGALIAAAAVAIALLAATGAGVAQARAMTRIRQRALADGGEGLQSDVSRGAIVAAALRGSIGVLTMVLVVLGAGLA